MAVTTGVVFERLPPDGYWLPQMARELPEGVVHAEVSRASDAWAATQMFRDNKAPKGFVDAEAFWTPDASNRGLTSFVGLGRP